MLESYFVRCPATTEAREAAAPKSFLPITKKTDILVQSKNLNLFKATVPKLKIKRINITFGDDGSGQNFFNAKSKYQGAHFSSNFTKPIFQAFGFQSSKKLIK